MINKDLLLKYLLFFYIILFPIKIFNLPITESKFQPGDLIFLLIITISIFNFKKIKGWYLSLIDKAVLIWILINILACIFNFTKNSLIELLGTFYLTTLYFTINLYFLNKKNEAIHDFFSKAISFHLIFQILIGIIGYITFYFGFDLNLFSFKANFPYFGDIYRLQGFTGKPNMLASIISIFILFLLTSSKKHILKQKWIYILGFLAVLLSFSKIIAILIACSTCLYFLKIKKMIFFYFFVFITFIFYFLATHFVIIGKNNFQNNNNYECNCKLPSIDLGNYYVVKTCYLSIKAKSIKAFMFSPILGIGMGNQPNFKNYEKDDNFLIGDTYDPHSSITGTLAEMGIIGFFALGFLFFSLFKTVYDSKKNKISNNDNFILYGLLSILIFMLCEAFCTDVMNFRHYWIIFAFIGAYYRKETNI